ncbi:MAG: hypothetical protein JWO07_451 [Candidatus Saccharibacteria bacterium]|nr:hypothetical protein [Candidatus Saccharibacteria bacterium]
MVVAERDVADAPVLAVDVVARVGCLAAALRASPVAVVCAEATIVGLVGAPAMLGMLERTEPWQRVAPGVGPVQNGVDDAGDVFQQQVAVQRFDAYAKADRISHELAKLGLVDLFQRPPCGALVLSAIGGLFAHVVPQSDSCSTEVVTIG